MLFGSEFSPLDGAFILYAALLSIAGVTDISRFIIPNSVSLALIALFVALGLYLQPSWSWWGLHLGAGALTLVIGYIAWQLRLFGAGDVKLLAAVALYPGVGELHRLLLYVALAGGVLTLALIVLRRAVALGATAFHSQPGALALPRILVERERIPYGVAISSGAILAGYEVISGYLLLL